MSTPIGIYNIHGIQDENKIIIQHKETVYPKEGEQLVDMTIDTYKIIENVFGKIYACNLTDKFILSTKTLPLFYVSIVYEIPLKTILLYRLYFNFTIEDDIKNSEQLIGNPINGKFSVDIFINNSKKTIDNNIEKFMGNDFTFKKLISFTMADEMKEMCKLMMDEIIIQLKEQYKDDVCNYEIPSNIISLKNYECDSSDE